MKRIKLHKRKNIKNIVLTIFIFIIMSVCVLFKLFNAKFTPILMNIAVSKSTNLGTLIITTAVNNKALNDLYMEDLFLIEKDENNVIKSIDFDSVKLNKLSDKIIREIKNYINDIEQENLENIEETISNNFNKKNIIYEIPSGVVFNNSLLSNLGPKIPVRMNMIGDIQAKINTEVENYGINNALLKISVNVSVNFNVILPFKSEKIEINEEIPIALKLIQGEVPNFYYPITN